MKSIGEFSRLGGVSVRTLRYYDRIGLLCPAEVDSETGYRWYLPSQLPDLTKIIALRQLGLSLAEIRELVTDPDKDSIRARLTRHRSSLAKRAEDDQRRLNQLDAALEAFEAERPILDDVVVKEVPAMRLAVITRPAPGFGKDNLAPVLRKAFSDLRHLLREQGVEPAGRAFSFYSDIADSGLLAHAAISIDPRTTELPEPLELWDAPAVPEVAVVVRSGDPDAIFPNVYRHLVRWARRNGYEPIGMGHDHLIHANPKTAEVVFECHLPLKRAGSSDRFREPQRAAPAQR
jgi:DNA-binding transcriptional MerR regulator